MMAKLLFGVLAFGCTVAIVASADAQFNEMIQFATDHEYTLSDYTNYGCHCGTNSMQGATVDETDRCCFEHDCCYKKAPMNGCTPVTTKYRFHTPRKHKITCSKTSNKCEEEVCECDKKAAECFRKEVKKYNVQFKNIASSPRCQGQKPSC